MAGNNNIDLNGLALLERGKKLTRQGDYASAVDVFNLAIDQNNEFAEAYFSRGACYYMLGYYRRAADDLNAASLFGCQDAQLWSKFETNSYEEDDEEDEDL